MKKINIVAIIPARGGSKGIKDKNIIPLKNKPLIAHSILTAQKCRFDKVIVSTDSKKFQKIALKFGADAPFLRPKKYSKDTSLDQEYLKHCYKWYYKNSYKIDIFIILRPTTPYRNYKQIRKIVDFFLRKKIDFLRSAHEAPESPFKWFKRKKDGFYKPISKNSDFNTTNLGRQKFEKVYVPNGYLDILRTRFIDKKNIYGKKMYVLVTRKTLEIDTLEEYNLAKKI